MWGRYSGGMAGPKRVTIGDIARLAGVSRGAVSFALNGRPGVSEATRRRILDIAAAEQWVPSSAARALVGSRSNVIGLAVNRAAGALGSEAFFTDLIAGVHSALAERGIALQMVLVSSVEEEVSTYRRWKNANQVDGVILLDPRDADPRPATLSEIGLAAVIIGSGPTAPGSPASLRLDDREATHALLAHLTGLEHRRLLYVSGPVALEHVRVRADVLRSGDAVEVDSIPTDFSADAVADATRSALNRAAGPTAAIYDNDVMAITGARIAAELGVSVPEDLSIASFDDSAIASLVQPSITCLTRDTFALGADAADFLLAQIASPTVLPDRTAATPHLTPRESTAQPPHPRRSSP